MKYLVYLLICFLIGFVTSRKQCSKVRGQVTCSINNGTSLADIKVYLMDFDAPFFNMDDLMAQTKTDKYGKFSLYGCAIDPFEGNDPDPYLKIVHKCTHDKKKVKMEIGLVPIFTANYQNIGKIELEDTRQSNKN